MRDRIPRYPGRVKITRADGTEEYVTLERADEPDEEGTPLNKATLLSDATAGKIGLADDDPTVDDAFNGLLDNIDKVYAVGDTLTTARTDLDERWALCNGDEVDKKLPVYDLLGERTGRASALASSQGIKHSRIQVVNNHAFVVLCQYYSNNYSPTIGVLDIRTGKTNNVYNSNVGNSAYYVSGNPAVLYINGYYLVVSGDGKEMLYTEDPMSNQWSRKVFDTTLQAFYYSMDSFLGDDGLWYIVTWESVYRITGFNAEALTLDAEKVLDLPSKAESKRLSHAEHCNGYLFCWLSYDSINNPGTQRYYLYDLYTLELLATVDAAGAGYYAYTRELGHIEYFNGKYYANSGSGESSGYGWCLGTDPYNFELKTMLSGGDFPTRELATSYDGSTKGTCYPKTCAVCGDYVYVQYAVNGNSYYKYIFRLKVSTGEWVQVYSFRNSEQVCDGDMLAVTNDKQDGVIWAWHYGTSSSNYRLNAYYIFSDKILPTITNDGAYTYIKVREEEL